MKRILKFYCSILLWASPVFSQAIEDHGFVTLTSSVPVDGILIDDSLHRAILPYRVTLKTGLHTIVAKNPKRINYLYTDFARTVEVRENEDMIIVIEFSELSTVNSYPYAAAVSVEESFLGETPFYLDLNRYKNQSLVFKKSGYDDVQFLVTDSALSQHAVFVKLNPKGPYASNHHDNQFKTVAWKERGISKNKGWLWMTGILGVTSGGLAAYYKNKADHTFDQAKTARRTGHRDLQRQLENRTEKYDRYSTVGFIAMQVNLGAVIYLLLKAK